MLSTRKRNYNPPLNNNEKTLNFLYITTLEKVTPDSVISTTLLKPIEFVRDVVSVRDIL